MASKQECADAGVPGLKTTLRMDPRYPNQNQTRACFENYCDFFTCQRLLSGDDSCKIFKKYYETICPKFWIEHWDEQRSKGTFPRVL